MFLGIRKYCPLWLAVIAVAMAFCGCNDNYKMGSPMSIRVTGYEQFASDYRMGLFCASPVNADNVPFTASVQGRAITDESINWGYAQTGSVGFMAYGPYDGSYTGLESVTVDIPNDQSSLERMNKANLLVSYTLGSPQQSSVVMDMEHAMTALMILLDNRTGSTISSVKVRGMMTSANFDLTTGKLTPVMPQKEVTPMRSPAGYDVYGLLYVPQDVSLHIDVTLESGKKINIVRNDCSSARGKVLNIGPVVLTDSISKELVLDQDDVKMSVWNTNGIPEFPVLPDPKKDTVSYSFTDQCLYGLYDMSNPDTITYGFAHAEGQTQVSFRNNTVGRSMQLVDFKNGMVEYCFVYDCKGNPVPGTEYTVSFNHFGNTEQSAFTIYMECVKVEDGMAWLVSRSGTRGLVLAI